MCAVSKITDVLEYCGFLVGLLLMKNLAF